MINDFIDNIRNWLVLRRRDKAGCGLYLPDPRGLGCVDFPDTHDIPTARRIARIVKRNIQNFAGIIGQFIAGDDAVRFLR